MFALLNLTTLAKLILDSYYGTGLTAVLTTKELMANIECGDSFGGAKSSR